MLKLKLLYFGHLRQTIDSKEKSLMLGKIEGRRRRGCQRMRWLDGITNAMDMNLSKPQEMVRDREALHVAFHGDCKELDMTRWLNNNIVFGISDIYTFNLYQWIGCNAKIVPILASSNGFLNFLSSPHWSLKSLNFLVFQDSQDYLLHFFTSPEISHVFENPWIVWWEIYLEAMC